jgi:endonuclease/exonuclease/phosphatase family metal-dependent hydrolase
MTSIVVASYNIHRGVGLDRRRDLDRIAGVIGELDPDAVGLQEVVCGKGGDHVDQAAYLASTLGMQLVMGETRPMGDGTYGNAVLTRLPVLGFERFDLSHPAREPRGCLRVDLAVNGGAVHLFNCHFGLAFRERRHQVHLLSGLIRSTGLDGPRIVMGDFNEWHRGPVTRRFRREFASPMRRVRRTHPSVLPIFPLDRIYWDAELQGEECRVHRSRRARLASDHLPIVVRLQARPAQARLPARATHAALLPAE